MLLVNEIEGDERIAKAAILLACDADGWANVTFRLRPDVLRRLPDLIEGMSGHHRAERALLEALEIGLEYLWRLDSQCQCICADAADAAAAEPSRILDA